jgi:hypothetical protein
MSEGDAHLCAWLALESGRSQGLRAVLERDYEDLYFNYYLVFYVLALARRALEIHRHELAALDEALDEALAGQEIHGKN